MLTCDVYTPENLNAPQTSTLWKGKTPSKSFLGCIYSESCKFDFDSFSPLGFFQIYIWHSAHFDWSNGTLLVCLEPKVMKPH